MANRYILDTSAIIRAPELLAHVPASELVIPQAVIDELEHRRDSGKSIYQLVVEAIDNGAELAAPATRSRQDRRLGSGLSGLLRGADLEIARTVLGYVSQHPSLDVHVITTDREIAGALRTSGIPSLSPTQFLALTSTSQPDPALLADAKNVVSKQWRALLIAIASSAITLIATQLSISYADIARQVAYLIQTISIWGTVVLILFLGVSLFWLRQHYRLQYGIVEFGLGFLWAVNVFFPEFDYSKIDYVHLIQIATSLYVMVRGLDNIGKGLEGGRLESAWRRVFAE
ncbi:MAG: hypothetical protein JSR24_16470 [Proteobacteria bacterium]|nr:hypothetical protein [Pseudomonadota bacterium]